MFTYLSKYSVFECISRLTQRPLHYRINWIYSRDYEIELVSKTSVFITFTKGYNLSSHRTKYQMDFYESSSMTKIILNFVSEKNGFPLPFVTDYEISKFLKQRIDAKLILTNPM